MTMTNTKRCTQAFAKLNGWSVTSGHFSFRQLTEKGRTNTSPIRDQAPLWWTGASDPALVMDHIQWFRQNRKPIAIISMPYHASIEDAQKLAQWYGLVVCAPRRSNAAGGGFQNGLGVTPCAPARWFAGYQSNAVRRRSRHSLLLGRIDDG